MGMSYGYARVPMAGESAAAQRYSWTRAARRRFVHGWTTRASARARAGQNRCPWSGDYRSEWAGPRNRRSERSW